MEGNGFRARYRLTRESSWLHEWSVGPSHEEIVMFLQEVWFYLLIEGAAVMTFEAMPLFEQVPVDQENLIGLGMWTLLLSMIEGHLEIEPF